MGVGGMWEQRKKEDNGMNSGGDGENGADSSPSQTLGDPENGKVSPVWPL